MNVRYNRVVAGGLLVLGLLCTLLVLWNSAATGTFSLAIVAGVMPMLIGALQLARPYFHIYDGVVVVPALVGPVKRRFEFVSLEAEGSKVFAVRADGTRKRIPVAKYLAQPDDWNSALTGVRRTE